MDDGPAIVFSDIHFGFEEESAARFRNFMDYFTGWVHGGQQVIVSSREKEPLEAPSKIILIGDILELLAPRKCDPTLPLRDSFDIFNSMIALKRDIIYVSGNHDEEVASYKRNYTFENGCQLTVYPDHYPVHEGGKLGLEIGENTYYFFHGHQFDSLWRRPRVRKTLNFIADSAAGIRHWKLFNWSGLIILSVTVGLLLLLRLRIDWLSWLASLLAAHEWWSPAALIGPFFWGFFLFLSIIWIFSWATQWYYHTTCSGYPSVLRDAQIGIIELLARGSFRQEIDTINANVVVFGHTHVPEKCWYEVEGTKKQLVNSGSWVTYEDHKSDCGWIDKIRSAVERSKQKDQKGNIRDTFVYIDGHGPLLLQWDHGKIRECELPTNERCLEH